MSLPGPRRSWLAAPRRQLFPVQDLTAPRAIAASRQGSPASLLSWLRVLGWPAADFRSLRRSRNPAIPVLALAGCGAERHDPRLAESAAGLAESCSIEDWTCE